MTDELQQKYMHMQMMQQQAVKVHQQMEMVEQQKQELQQVVESLEGLKTAKKGSDTFMPLAGGIFVKGKIEETDKVVVNVGSNVTVTKTVPEAIEFVNDQVVELGKVRDQLMANLQKIMAKAQQVEADLKESVM